MLRPILGGCLMVLMSCFVFGQDRPVFEVASIRPRIADGEFKKREGEKINAVPGSLTMRNVSLASVISWAYDVKEFQISGPAWLTSERFDVAAKASGPVPESQLRIMLQELLADRFKVVLHRETKQLSVYALVVAKGGPKCRQSESEGESVVNPNRSTGIVVAQRTTVSSLVDILSRVLRTPVVDQTGLKGSYDCSVDTNSYRPVEGQPFDPTSVIMTALPEQLGLKLEARKAPVEILIVDRAEKVPTEN